MILGWILTDASDLDRPNPGGEVLGDLPRLEAIFARCRPTLALVTLPAVMSDQIQSIRTRLRKFGVPDRFFPTLEDQLSGVGPRARLTIDLNDLLGRPPRAIDERAVGALLRSRRVLITGAGGSIGSELARLAARYRPAALHLVDRSENALFEIDRQIARHHPDVSRHAHLHDVVKARETRSLFGRLQPEIVFHAAAHKHVPMMEDHPAEAIDNNLFGTKSVADAADGAGAIRFVMISTDKAVNPTSIMGATKRLAEMYIQDLQTRSATAFAMVRFGNVLGSSGSVLDVWSRQIAEGGPLSITDPRMTRYFMTIPEAAALVVQASSMVEPDAGAADIYVLNMGEPVAILDLAVRFAQLHGLTPVLRHGDQHKKDTPAPAHIGIVTIGMRPGEKLHEMLVRESDALLPTSHPDINILHLAPPYSHDVEAMLERLHPEYRDRDHDALAAQVAESVPEMGPPVVA